MKIPSLVLKRLYTYGSLKNVRGGIRFSLKNRLSDALLTRVLRISVAGREVPLAQVRLEFEDGSERPATDLCPENPVPFPLRKVVHVFVPEVTLEPGKYRIGVAVRAEPFGELAFDVEDAIKAEPVRRTAVPRDPVDDYSRKMAETRQRFVEKFSGVSLKHVSSFSFDPKVTAGNIENFVGVAQIPIGIAGPIRINGEHAQGEFLVPLATTEGTLVASYNRGIKVVNLSGGVTCTVQDDRMQRAPVFVFASAREARAFAHWVEAHKAQIREAAEATSSVAKLLEIDTYLSNRFAYLRFNYTTGDAAGQNMVGRATFAACSWIIDHVEGEVEIKRFFLESNLATDKKASQVNIMRTRGKRVTAEAVIPRNILIENMRTEPESLHYHLNVANVGAFLSAANNNGAHSPNAITAMFIATGQDVANVAESSAGIVYTEIQDDGSLYMSLTIPSLIVATYGGGTGLPTQQECLAMLGCTGRGKVRKLAEIIAGVALAGELSLGAAISASDWVSSHEQYGRNR